MSYTDDRIFLIECMVRSGYTQNSARNWLNTFVDRANNRAIDESDHSAYRELADKVNDLLGESVDDPDLWDGDDSELKILMDFLEWVPDMIQHRAAIEIRKNAAQISGINDVAAAFLSSRIDPFRRGLDKGGCEVWIRKRDGAQVPDRVAQLG